MLRSNLTKKFCCPNNEGCPPCRSSFTRSRPSFLAQKPTNYSEIKNLLKKLRTLFTSGVAKAVLLPQIQVTSIDSEKALISLLLPKGPEDSGNESKIALVTSFTFTYQIPNNWTVILQVDPETAEMLLEDCYLCLHTPDLVSGACLALPVVELIFAGSLSKVTLASDETHKIIIWDISPDELPAEVKHWP